MEVGISFERGNPVFPKWEGVSLDDTRPDESTVELSEIEP